MIIRGGTTVFRALRDDWFTLLVRSKVKTTAFRRSDLSMIF